MSESYSAITVVLVRVLPKSVLVRSQSGDEVFVARSCIHGADERGLERVAEESESPRRARSRSGCSIGWRRRNFEPLPARGFHSAQRCPVEFQDRLRRADR